MQIQFQAGGRLQMARAGPATRAGAPIKSHFRQGSFADGKGRTGKKPTLAGAQAKNPISGRGRVQRARA